MSWMNWEPTPRGRTADTDNTASAAAAMHQSPESAVSLGSAVSPPLRRPLQDDIPDYLADVESWPSWLRESWAERVEMLRRLAPRSSLETCERWAWMTYRSLGKQHAEQEADR